MESGGGGMSETYATTTVTQTEVITAQPYLDIAYLKTLPGILKVIQAVSAAPLRLVLRQGLDGRAV